MITAEKARVLTGKYRNGKTPRLTLSRLKSLREEAGRQIRLACENGCDRARVLTRESELVAGTVVKDIVSNGYRAKIGKSGKLNILVIRW